MKPDASDLAFPIIIPGDPDDTCYGAVGLTKRELFAAMAMQGIVSAAERPDMNVVAAWSVQTADALIAALNEGGEA